ncbi:hypothetical protein [Kribbella kalugense]|uniref:Uncharacterized protein n=1 Tax=Kribbella kalugense TaxID=2512221 RepID=A0A4V3G8L5_9ACTN|nr:hypothetical protein [Kribbella kalugense]TDW23364.1 hypothetical protein EV650_2217 [Kribbella kalugense]
MSREPVGSIAEEAAKLFAVLQNAAGDEPPPADSADEKHEHKLGPDCVWCPVCQLIHRVRNTSPETIEQLSTAAAQVLGSLRTLLEAAADAARQSREDAAPRSPQPDEETNRPRVDRIDVSEDPEPWD